METLSAIDIVKFNFNRAVSFVQAHLGMFIAFTVFLFIQDLINFALSQQFSEMGSDPRWIEGGFQFFFLWSSAYFYHIVNCTITKREVNWVRALGESLLLFPGYILQSIFWTLCFVGGLLLFVIPGIYCGVAFYMAPMISILYPDYSGTTFTLSRNFAHQDLKATFAIVLFTSLTPFIPEGLLFFLTGSLKSVWGLIYSPIGGGLYLFCELIFLFFVWDKIEAHRKENASI